MSPAIALPAAAMLTLSFDALSFDDAGRCASSGDFDSHDVRITTDDGATWTTLNDCFALADGTGEIVANSFDVTVFAGQTVRVYFTYDTKNQASGHTFAVDNVRITQRLEACSNAAVADGSTCDDGDPATCDACFAGVCAGEDVEPPPEVGDSLRIAKSPGGDVVTWEGAPGPFNVYRGLVDPAAAFLPYAHECFDPRTEGPTVDGSNPAGGSFVFYLVSRVDRCKESVVGRDGTGAPIPNPHSCP